MVRTDDRPRGLVIGVEERRCRLTMMSGVGGGGGGVLVIHGEDRW